MVFCVELKNWLFFCEDDVWLVVRKDLRCFLFTGKRGSTVEKKDDRFV